MARTPSITPAMCARGRSLADPRWAPDGSVSYVLGSGGRAQLVHRPLHGPERVVTADGVRAGHAWLPDGGAVIVVAADGRLACAPAAGGPTTPLADLKPAASPVVAPDGRSVAWVVDTRDIAVVDLGGERPWPVRVSSGRNDFALEPAWSADGDRLAWVEWDVPAMPWDEAALVMARRDGSGRRVVDGGDGVAVQQPRFSPDGRHLAYLSDRGGFVNLWIAAADGTEPRVLVEEPFEHGEPAWGPGQRSFAWSPDGAAIAFCRNEGGFGRLCVVDVDTAAVREVAKGWHVGLDWGPGGVLAVRSGARTPDELVVHDPVVEGGAGRTVLAVGPVAFPDEALVEPELVTWSGDGDVAVHGRLYRPPDAAGPTPLLVWIHGGPTGQAAVTFQPRFAYFLDRGWSILVPDHRGSTGWGRSYTQAMREGWGVVDVADCAAGMRAAVERGWADPARMVPIGGSAGGFTVLHLLAASPHLCAAGVDFYGVADLLDLSETTHRFEAHYLDSIVGPLPDAATRYRERSPVSFADRITAPLLILQGDADEVVPLAQSRAMAARIERAGGTVELHVYEGEGHGWSRPETAEDALARTESFLRRHVLQHGR